MLSPLFGWAKYHNIGRSFSRHIYVYVYVRCLSPPYTLPLFQTLPDAKISDLAAKQGRVFTLKQVRSVTLGQCRRQQAPLAAGHPLTTPILQLKLERVALGSTLCP